MTVRSSPTSLLAGLLAACSMLAISAFTASPAAADRSGSTTNDEIARLYLGVFGRAPDLGGEAYWNHRANSDVTTEEIAAYFVDSDEFRDRFGTGDDAVLTQLYRNVLGREPDAGGLVWWQDQIAAGRDISNVVRNFTESPENLALAASIPSRYDDSAIDGCDTPLDDYLQSYLGWIEQTVTIAVHDHRTDCSYGINADDLMTTASTFKLAVMGSMLLRAQDEGRSLSTNELAQLDAMIRFSDDLDVSAVVSTMGGSSAMLDRYAARLGITEWENEARWGCVAWGAASATSLIEHLTIEGVGELTADSRAQAVDLLTNVTPSQRWGVGDGTTSVSNSTVAQKNGFARGCGAGSRLNSVGMVLNGDGQPMYSIAIYSVGWVDGQAASRQNDQPAYVLQGRSHMDHIAQHVARMLTR